MDSLSFLYWVFIIGGAVISIILTIKLWRMCDDVRVLRNHFAPATENNTTSKGKDYTWMIWPLIIAAIFIAILALSDN